jgi:hypothetical protein
MKWLCHIDVSLRPFGVFAQQDTSIGSDWTHFSIDAGDYAGYIGAYRKQVAHRREGPPIPPLVVE